MSRSASRPPRGVGGARRSLIALAWLGAAALLGVLVGRLSVRSGIEVSGAIAAVILFAFAYLAVAHPHRAVALFLVLSFSGLANWISIQVRGTSIDAGTFLVILLFGGWLVSNRGLSRSAEGVASLTVLGFTLVAFAALGSVKGQPWSVAQEDVVPALFLLSFPPILSACTDERRMRLIIGAAGVGIGLMAAWMVWLYVLHFNQVGETSGEVARILGEDGLAGGPRVLPAFHRGSLFPAGLVGAVLLLRPEAEGPVGGRLRIALAVLAAGCGLAILLTYSRSLMITAPAALVVGAMLAASDVLRIARPLLAAVIVALFLLLAVPLLTGGSVGGALSGLRSRFSDISSDVSYTQRIDEDREGLQAFAESPFIGHGLGADVVVPEYPNRLPGYFHNAFVGLLVKTGVVGTAIFAVVVVGLLARLVREARRARGYVRAVMAAAAAWMVGLLVASSSEPFILFPPGYQYIALTAALAAYAHAHRTGAAPADEATAALADARAPVGGMTGEPPVRSW